MRFLIVGIVCVAAVIIASVLLTRTSYTVLYRDMDPAQAGEILAKLKDQGVDARPSGPTAILVPEKQADEIIMQLSAEGYPQTGFTYDIFAGSTGFGVTESEKREYAKFQLQDRLQKTIELNRGIKKAVVTISMPDSSQFVFTSEVVPATASVMLVMENNATLSDQAIKAIENLVATSVEGLKPENISITNNGLELTNHKEFNNAEAIESNLEFEKKVKEELTRSVMKLLSPIFGEGHVQVSVSTKLNFDKKNSDGVTFSPVVDDEGIVISMHEINEKATGVKGNGGVPGTDTNGAAPQYPELANNDTSAYSNITRDVNYEVNELHEQIEKAQGQIDELSVSVAIDSNLNGGEDEMAVRNLVAGALGLVSDSDVSRIKVQFMKFIGLEDENKKKDEYNALVERQMLFDLIKTIALYLVILAAVIVLMIYIIKIMGYDKKKREAEEASARAVEAAAAVEAARENMENEIQRQVDMRSRTLDGGIEEYRDLVSLVSDSGEITVSKSTVMEQIEKFISKNPEDAASLLRNWLYEDPKGGRR